MKAMVLAAGRGNRLRPLTNTCPKPMLPVGGKPLLEHVVRLLAKHGFDQLVVNLHHLPEQIEDYFGDGRRWGVRIHYALETTLLGTAGSVRRQAGFFDEPFLVYYGDNLTNMDLGDFWQAHRAAGEIASMGLHREDDPCRSGIVRLDARSRVVEFIEKPRPEQVFPDFQINCGIYALAPGIFAWIPEGDPCDLGAQVFPGLLAGGQSIYGHPMRGHLLASDTPERYAAARARIDAGLFDLP
ncbi:MAG: nucleotidyltransferase family protein [Candidatus Latescibacteria bacterium]|nr:nucleotidyltransferase family protein [Candidatus Latescibacterota bacterium]